MFGDKLENMVGSVQGGQAAILMGLDGIPVDSFVGDGEWDIETVGMEFSVVLKEVRKASELLEAGATFEFTVRAGKLTTVVRLVDENYFLAMALSPDGNLGKARYLLRMLVPELAEDLA